MITLTIRLAERHVDGGTIVDVAIDSKGDPCTKLERFHADVIERSVKAGLQALVIKATDAGIKSGYLERSNSPG